MSEKPDIGLNTAVFDDVIETGRTMARLRLAEQLAQLACNEDAPKAERDSIIPTLLKLAVDPVSDVRRTLAKALAGCTMLHPDVLFSIVADDEDISLPFLAATPSLDAPRALAILKVGDEARRLIIAARPDLAADAVSWICDSASRNVCACLLANDKVHVTAGDYRRLYMRFREHKDIVDALLARHDLPLEVRILQARRASDNIHRLMAEKGWLAANDAEEIVADAEETTLLKILRSATEEELARLVTFVCRKSLMTPAILLRAGIAGEMKIIVHALAFLSSTSVQKLQKLVAGRNVMGLRSVCNKAGLPQDGFAILRAACDVAAENPKQNSAAFGLLLVEYLATRYSSLTLDDRMRLLAIVERFGDDNTRDLAHRLAGELKAAA